jgi:hypothetical protein
MYMKRFLLPLFVFLLFICNSAFLKASELEILGGFNGLTYNPDKTDAYSEPDTEKHFTYYPFGLANVNFRHDISEILNFSLNIERDNVLQNSFSTILGVKTDYINVNFGVFAGLTDKFTRPDAGITGNLELIAAEILFLSISGSSTIGTQYSFTSNNARETAGIKLGVWIGNTIPSISAEMKNFSRQVEDNIFTDDTLYRFSFKLDFLIKNTNTSGYVNTGYQVYSRTYKKETLEFTDSLSSYFAGFGLYWQSKPLGFKIGAEMPFVITPEAPMTAAHFTKDYFLFSKAYAGVVFTFE